MISFVIIRYELVGVREGWFTSPRCTLISRGELSQHLGPLLALTRITVPILNGIDCPCEKQGGKNQMIFFLLVIFSSENTVHLQKEPDALCKNVVTI